MRARRLQSMLGVIKSREGKLDLQFLGERKPADAYDYLASFFGIGPKTAACTLLFAFGMPLFPVDKGIHRMCRRLRLVRAKAGEAETERSMEAALVPTAAKVYPLHVLMFRHAKTFCRPRNPKCGACRLAEVCPSGQLRLRHRRDRQVDRPPSPPRLSRQMSSGLIKHGDGELD
jgi:endonuclease-3